MFCNAGYIKVLFGLNGYNLEMTPDVLVNQQMS